MDRISITLDRALGAAVRAAAGQAGQSVSRWLGRAAEDRLRTELLGAALDEWEAEHGAFTGEELAEAASVLDAPAPRVVVLTRGEAAG